MSTKLSRVAGITVNNEREISKDKLYINQVKTTISKVLTPNLTPLQI